MRRNSSSLHLKIAEWILERDEAVSVYDVMAKFGITRHQAMGHLSILERDDAIKMQKNDTIINSHCRHTIKTVTITYIDRKKIAQRKRSPNYHHYKSHPVKSVSDLPPSEKWEWLIKNSRRRKV
ncbi:hypothetical protein MU985_003433 [Salmonella enterica]|nr:hypothetical protein [Salmonella enterica subsp. diarizonae serovar 48:i:z]EEM9674167.1 hypothetical protein [Salmonella enterica]EHG4042727.1 hypothetical protein [Salmonella enterica]EHG7962749.1 hypothetical protein [Salmonella enterica]EHG7980818.1 hypothetical protein [Salmonella enterica]